MWPVTHAQQVLLLRQQSTDSSAAKPEAIVPDSHRIHSWGPLTLAGIEGMHRGDLFYLSVGLLVWLFTWPSDAVAATWPALSELLTSWVALVVVRNLVLEVALYESWHQLLFGFLKTPAVEARRFSSFDPYDGTTAVWRERFFCTCGFIWSSLYECLVVHIWASGVVPECDDKVLAGPFGSACRMATPSWNDIMERPLVVTWFLLAFAVTTQFRGIHFFFCHRMMHPWWDQNNGLKQGDVGAFLYRHVHSLHHKSYNPGPWSSLSMHPVEHMLYFSCFFLAFFVPYHPLHLLLNKYHTDISALAGHDGHASPGAADVGHYLHHAHFECNYGFSFPNYLDKFFGTFDDGTKYRVSNSSLRASLLDVPMTAEEVARHSSSDDAWMVLHGHVLDVTHWANQHPGGAKLILDNAGKDATRIFDAMHKTKGGFELVDKFKVPKLGMLQGPT
jgi:cytochrome b involved in lipid metabolism